MISFAPLSSRTLSQRLLLALAAVGLTGASASPSMAAPVKKEGVTVELVSEYDAAVPGTTLALGLAISHLPTFHTYWRQPGLVGLAPMLEWSLPEGCTHGEILWPAPEFTTMASYRVWGYERDICLVVPVHIPATLDPAQTPALTFQLKAIWMACGRTCHPGQETLTLTLPVRAQDALPPSATAAAAQFAATRREQAQVDEAWKTEAVCTEEGGFRLTVTPPPGSRVPADLYFFSYGRLVDSNEPQRREDHADGRVTLHLALVEEPDPTPETLEGELFAPTSGKEVNTPLRLKIAPKLTSASSASR